MADQFDQMQKAFHHILGEESLKLDEMHECYQERINEKEHQIAQLKETITACVRAQATDGGWKDKKIAELEQTIVEITEFWRKRGEELNQEIKDRKASKDWQVNQLLDELQNKIQELAHLEMERDAMKERLQDMNQKSEGEQAQIEDLKNRNNRLEQGLWKLERELQETLMRTDAERAEGVNLHQRYQSLTRESVINQEGSTRNATMYEMQSEWNSMMRNHAELFYNLDRSSYSNGDVESVTIGIIGCAIGLVLIVMVIALFLCGRWRSQKIKPCDKNHRKLSEHSSISRQPVSVDININEMDQIGLDLRPQCSREPRIAEMNHSILADNVDPFGLNAIDEVTDGEGIDVSTLTTPTLFLKVGLRSGHGPIFDGAVSSRVLVMEKFFYVCYMSFLCVLTEYRI